jgi:homoserine dehydrogenase
MAAKAVNVAIVGGGTVGGGIVEILSGKATFLRDQLGVEAKISKICVRDASRQRDFAVPDGCKIVTDVNEILDDAAVEMVVEVMGGTDLAKTVVTKALKAGKHVVTANKALIAQDLPELKALIASVNEGRETPVSFGYEAAVCGGIPIIHALQRDFLGDEVTQLSGIINGCTNFMLSNMAKGGLSYSASLAEASELGYAEADPTLDVGGFDARSKLRILIKLAFGLDVIEDEIPVRGITEVTATDFDYAKSLDGTIKLLGVAKLDRPKGKLSAFVSPCFVKDSNTLAAIDGATNAIQVDSASLQQSILVGQGAGRFPTANSCVSDILDILQGTGAKQPFPKVSSDLKFVNTFNSAFYIRIRFRDGVGIISDLGDVFKDGGVSIYSILQNPIGNPEDAVFVVVTDPVDVSSVKKVCASLEATDWCLGDIFYMPVL